MRRAPATGRGGGFGSELAQRAMARDNSRPMKRRVLHPNDLLLRCLALRRDGYWVALCIDLDLAAQADTAAQARKLLKEQIASYVTDAVGVDSEHAHTLLRRRAPLRYLALYHWIKLVNATRARQSYEAAVPMVPARA